MLSIGPMSGGQENYYLRLSREDYYLDGGEPPGHWWGEGAEQLGLKGRVEPDALSAVFKGFGPDGAALVQNAGSDHRRPGFDLTFSAPKSVSVFWASARDDARRDIQEAQAEAVKAALAYIQDEAGYTRTGQRGHTWHQSSLVAALFEHGTSRALDPQLHTHALLMNVGVNEDGRTRALAHTQIFRVKMAAGAIYRAELAAQLENRLGLHIDRDTKNGFSFIVRGVSESLCAFFSNRRKEIEKVLGADGLESARAAEIVTKETRAIKEVVPPRQELFAQWRELCDEFHLTPEATHQLLAKAPARLFKDANPYRAFDEALEVIARTESHFTANELMEKFAEAAIGRGVGAKTLRATFDEALSSDARIVALQKDSAGRQHYTTKGILENEKNLLATVDQLKAHMDHGVGLGVRSEIMSRYANPRSAVVEELKHHAAGLIQAAKREKHPAVNREQTRADAGFVLSEEQSTAIHHLTAPAVGSIRCLEGAAGTGKTRTLAVAREIWEKDGKEVIGVALAGKAVEELRGGAKMRSMSFAMLSTIMKDDFLDRWKHHGRQIYHAARGEPTFAREPFELKKNHVLVVDEASMMGTRELAFLTDRAAKAGALLVLVGDRTQLQAIGPGGGFAAIADRVGAARLDNVVRQRAEADRVMVADFRAGRAEQALKSLNDRGLLTIAEDHSAAMKRLTDDWLAKEKDYRSGKSLIFVNTNAEAKEINQNCQKALQEDGRLGSRYIKIDKERIHIGDRVLLSETSSKVGVNNGDTGTVVGLQTTPWKGNWKNGVTVRLDRGKRVHLSLADYDAISLGYAVTTHKGQGTTVERAYILAGGSMQDRESSYVQASRARDTVRLYTSRHEAGESLEGLAKSMNRSHQKTLATTLRSDPAEEQIHQQTLRQALRAGGK